MQNRYTAYTYRCVHIYIYMCAVRVCSGVPPTHVPRYFSTRVCKWTLAGLGIGSIRLDAPNIHNCPPIRTNGRSYNIYLKLFFSFSLSLYPTQSVRRLWCGAVKSIFKHQSTKSLKERERQSTTSFGRYSAGGNGENRKDTFKKRNNNRGMAI